MAAIFATVVADSTFLQNTNFNLFMRAAAGPPMVSLKMPSLMSHSHFAVDFAFAINWTSIGFQWYWSH